MTMNTEVYNKIAGGASVADLLKAYEDELRAAEAKYKAEQEEKKRKAEEEVKRAKEVQERAQRDLDAKKITELANRALNHKTTSEDIAWLWGRYTAQKWGKSEAVTKACMTAKDIDDMVDMAVKMFNSLEPLMKNFGISWKDMDTEVAKFFAGDKEKTKAKNKNEDDVIREFVKKIL